MGLWFCTLILYHLMNLMVWVKTIYLLVVLSCYVVRLVCEVMFCLFYVLTFMLSFLSDHCRHVSARIDLFSVILIFVSFLAFLISISFYVIKCKSENGRWHSISSLELINTTFVLCPTTKLSWNFIELVGGQYFIPTEFVKKFSIYFTVLY